VVATVDYTGDYVGDTERTQTVVNDNILTYDYGFVQPASLAWGSGLSHQVQAALPDLVAAILDAVAVSRHPPAGSAVVLDGNRLNHRSGGADLIV